jgi:hypothetical protein
VKVINDSIVTYVHRVPEAAVRQALTLEAAEAHGLTTDGKLTPGVSSKVTFDGRRGNLGEYTVEIVFDRAKAGQAVLPKSGDR